MQDFYRRCAVTIGLGSSVAIASMILVAAQAKATADSSIFASMVASWELEIDSQAKRPNADKSPALPGKLTQQRAEALPVLSAEMSVDETDLAGEMAPLPNVSPEAMPADAIDVETSPSMDVEDEPLLQPLPESLQPLSNPLAVPTQPEDVEILETEHISLETAIELAYQNNEDLQITFLQLERSQAALREAQAALYPTLDLSTNINRQNSSSSNAANSVSTGVGGSIGISYSLGLNGNRTANIAAAELTVRSEVLDVEEQQEELRLNTANDYYELQRATEQIRINQTFLEEAERNLQNTTIRQSAGVGTRLDVLRAEVQVANARQDVVQAQSQELIAQRRLAERLNISPTVDLIALPVEIAEVWPLSVEESIVLAYQNRAELARLLLEREILGQQQRVALSALRPDVSVSASYGITYSEQQVSGMLTDGTNGDFNVRAELQWRLFDGGAASAITAQQSLDIEIAERQFANTRNRIRREVEEAYFSLTANQANIGTAQLAVQQAEEALEFTNLRFNAGVGTQLDVLTAIRELAEAEGRLVSAILDYNQALASLERAVSNVVLGS